MEYINRKTKKEGELLMNKAEYFLDILTPAAIEKMYSTHGEGDVEISNMPYFTNPDASRDKMVQSYKDANKEIIESLKSQLVGAQYEFMTIAHFKGLISGTGKPKEDEIDYAEEEYERAENEIKELMNQYDIAVKAQSEIENWFK